MSKGNKEAKKPKAKKVHVPNPQALPSNLTPAAVGALRPKKR